jgi:hypothetical protein
MRIDKSKWQRKRLRIEVLKPHPDQERLYGGTTTPAQEEGFARDLADRGQLDEIHVLPFPNAAGLPKGTVIDGWRRTMAAKANGGKHIDGYIRHDLAKASAAEVAAEFAKFNPNRRQLSRLALARNIEYQIKSQRGHSGPLGWRDREKVKRQIGEQLGLDIRTINRYLLVLGSPLEVQRAFDRGEVPLVEAGRVSLLTKHEQKEVSERIAAGEAAKKVVREHIKTRSGRHQKAADGFTRFARDLERGLADIEDRADEIYRGAIKEKLPLLRRSARLIAKLMAEGRKKFLSQQEMIAEFRSFTESLKGNGK